MYLNSEHERASSTERGPLEAGLEARLELLLCDDEVEDAESDQRHDRQDARHEVHGAATVPGKVSYSGKLIELFTIKAKVQLNRDVVGKN